MELARAVIRFTVTILYLNYYVVTLSTVHLKGWCYNRQRSVLKYLSRNGVWPVARKVAGTVLQYKVP